MLSYRINLNNYQSSDLNIIPDTSPMDASMVSKLDDPSTPGNYTFDMVQFYTNVGACNNQNLTSGFFFDGTNLPNCFFPIHFIKANQAVCQVDKSTVPQQVLDDLQV